MWRRFDSDDPTAAAEFEAGYRDVLQRTARTGAALVLMEPFLLPVRDEQLAWRDDLDEKIAVVHKLAAEFGASLVPLDAAFAARDEPAIELAADGVHPTELGHSVIAERWRFASGF
jgi:lysophospholipase L1-like esterase